MHSILNIINKISVVEDGSECACYFLKYRNNVQIIC